MAQVRFKSFSNRSSLDKTRPCSGGNLYLSHRLEQISIGLSPLGSRYENRADFDCEQHVRIQHRMGGVHGHRHVAGDPTNYLYAICVSANYHRYDRWCGERIDRVTGNVLLLATLATKAEQAEYLSSHLADHGVTVRAIDVSLQTGGKLYAAR